MKLTHLILVGLIGILDVGCASTKNSLPTSFPYKFYFLDVASNALIGGSATDDLSVPKVCVDTTGKDHPCIVMMKVDFELLYQDYLEDE
jgi:hypothetical protein